MLVGCGHHKPVQAPIAKDATVLILGDSLSYGTGASPGEDYVTQVAQHTGWKMINAGVPGDTTGGGLARLPSLLEEYQPQLVIVELGGNDLLRQAPVNQIEENLRSILALAKANGSKTVLVAIPEISALAAMFNDLSDHPLYARIAEQTATPLVPNVFSDVLSKRELKSDQIHPNARGYHLVAEKMVESLKQLGYVQAAQ